LTQKLKKVSVDNYVCESFLKCPKTVRVIKLEDGTFEISACINQKHIHKLSPLRKRRILIEKFFKECNNNDIEIKLNLKNYLKKNGIGEISSRQMSYYLKYLNKTR
jgi:hypothetical protein